MYPCILFGLIALIGVLVDFHQILQAHILHIGYIIIPIFFKVHVTNDKLQTAFLTIGLNGRFQFTLDLGFFRCIRVTVSCAG